MNFTCCSFLESLPSSLDKILLMILRDETFQLPGITSEIPATILSMLSLVGEQWTEEQKVECKYSICFSALLYNMFLDASLRITGGYKFYLFRRIKCQCEVKDSLVSSWVNYIPRAFLLQCQIQRMVFGLDITYN